MMVADVLVWVGALFLVGLVGFFVMAAVLVGRFLGFAFRALFGGSPAERPSTAAARPRRRVCPHARCGHVNPSTAQYCGRCGRQLRATRDVDAHG